MTKIKVIVCSNSGVDYVKHPYDIEVFRSIVQYSETEKYDDFTEISAETFYNRLDTDKASFPHTAYVTPGHMLEVFEKAKADGYEGALVIVIAKPLSGLYNAVCVQAGNVENFKVTVYDSKTIAYPEALMAVEAARMFSEDKSMEEVLARLDYIGANQHIVFAVDTLEYLIKNGRLSKAAGFAANLLAIRPILALDETGKIITLEKCRTSKKARARAIEIFLDEVKDKDVIPFILHTCASEEVLEETRKAVLAVHPEYGKIEAYLLTPVVGAHSGPRTIALGWIKK